ncbi:N-acylmannosamine kinase [Dictyobacter sp. S3.2.2.5]|uniref:N-acylmannosamine kinase n=1 Tax=Dictyobacter halimunensis TaxID=3026934 RepID=A0ABQ6FIP4_9CHLR|nr:N-acylmannosamine kinase [Dictyobacter sp. S3.2.2.5]
MADRVISAQDAILAFDVGGTRMKTGIIRGDTLIKGEVVALNHTAGDQTDDVLGSIIRLSRAALAQHTISAIGLSLRGIVDPQSGIILDVNEALRELIHVPLGERLSQELGRPIFVENDARMYTLGEFIHGAGRGYQNMLCLTLGTGVGSGVVIGGRLLRGQRSIRGILGGHLTIQANGPRCSCGNVGCLEALVGTSALIRQIEEGLAKDPSSLLHTTAHTPRHLFAAAAQHDRLALAIVDTFAHHLGCGIVSLIHAYDPDVVVLGGGFIHSHQLFLSAVQAYVNSHAWTIPRGRVAIVPAALGDMAALFGVAASISQPDIYL